MTLHPFLAGICEPHQPFDLKLRPRVRQIEQPGLAHGAPDRADPVGPLGVMRAGHVQREIGAGAEAGHTFPPRYTRHLLAYIMFRMPVQ